MVVATSTPLQRRIRTAGFAFFLVLIAVSITSTFLGVLNGLSSPEVRDPIPAICPPAAVEAPHG